MDPPTQPSEWKSSWTRKGSARILSVVDSGPLYAAVDTADANHERSLATLQRGELRLVIPTMVIAEATYWIGKKIGGIGEAEFLASLAEFEIEPPHPEDWTRIGELVAQYADLGLGGTDASVIALAERLNASVIVTLDRRHFSAVRPRHIQAFELIPGGT